MSILKKKRAVIDDAFLMSLETLDLYIKRTMTGSFGGKRKSNGAGSSCEFLDYRDYVPGDDIRRIDWNLAARLDRFYIRRYVDERQQETQIYLDLSASMDTDRSGKKAIASLHAAMAFGFISVQNMDRVSFKLLHGEDCSNLCGSLMGRQAFYVAASQLADVSFEGSVDLESAIRHDPTPCYNNGLSLIISDFLTDSNWKKAAEYLLSRKRQVALIRICSEDEETPDFVGPSLLIDSEFTSPSSQKSLRVSVDRKTLNAYRQSLTRFDQEIATFCAQNNLSYLRIPANQPVPDTIIRHGFASELIQ